MAETVRERLTRLQARRDEINRQVRPPSPPQGGARMRELLDELQAVENEIDALEAKLAPPKP